MSATTSTTTSFAAGTAPAQSRTLDGRDLAYERLGDQFVEALSEYDTQRRVETLVDLFLGDIDLSGKRVLEVGTGLGYFARRMHERGAKVIATDIAPSLVEKVRKNVGCEAEVADAMRLTDQFETGSFDVILSSECVEHTPDPNVAVRQMASLLKPGGYLSLSTPNIVWQPIVRLASTLKLRPFDGLENFSSFGGLRKLLAQEGCEVIREQGLHLFPFQFGMQGLSRWCDRNLQPLRCGMINICLLARKQG
ncbi:MAG: class I SAM-dependent methyltransferase [Planctomycetaceae bacterium]